MEIAHDLAVLSAPIQLSQQFDALGRRVGLSDNLGGEVAYAYDAVGRLTNVGMTVNSVVGPQVAFTYNAIGQTTSISRQATPAAPTVDTTYTYDSLGRLLNLNHTVNDGVAVDTLSAYAWTYDSLNRLISYVGPDGSLTFDYDATGHLLGVDGDREEAYEYDENGNRIMSGYVIGDNNQLLADGVFAYTYDAEGNRLTKTRLSSDPADDYLTEYAWDHRNRLIGVTVKDELGNVTATADYTYDVFDRLIVRVYQIGSQAPQETATIYDHTGRYEHGRAMDEALADFARDADTGDWSLTSRYLYGQAYDQILARYDVDGESRFYLTDHQGSVRQNVDADGTLVNEIVYDAYGNILSETNPSAGDRFKYTAREWDALIGLQYNRARWYDPRVGAWTAEDPIGFNSGQFNHVVYVGNSPTNATDPSGLANYWNPLTWGLRSPADQGWAGFFNPISGESRAAVGGFFQGAGHGGAMIANAATLQQVTPLNSYVNETIATQGGVYNAANWSARGGVAAGYAATGVWAWSAAAPTYAAAAAGVNNASITAWVWGSNIAAEYHLGTVATLVGLNVTWADYGQRVKEHGCYFGAFNEMVLEAQGNGFFLVGFHLAQMNLLARSAGRNPQIRPKVDAPKVDASNRAGETVSTTTGKSAHKSLADARRASGDFDLVQSAIKDKNGNPILVSKRVNLKTGQPQPGAKLQEAMPDAVSFRRKLIVDDKPLGRPIAKDRQEMIRFIEAYRRREGSLPDVIGVQRYDPATGQPVLTELYSPSDFLP